MNKAKYRVVDEADREYFECDCHDNEHVLRVEHQKYDDEGGKTFLDEITFRFKATMGDWEANYPMGPYSSRLKYVRHEWANKFRRLKWRFKMATTILFKGRFELYDEWIPERRGAEIMRGKKEVSKLLLWLAKKHMEISERQIQFSKMTPEELKEYHEFVEYWSSYTFEDDNA